MPEYIERKAAKCAIRDLPAELDALSVQRAIEVVDRVSAADVVPVQHGRWHDVYMSSPSSYVGTCSVCGVTNDIPHPMLAYYCPNCGAKMDIES